MRKLYLCEQREYPRDTLPDGITHVTITCDRTTLRYRVRFHSSHGYTISPKCCDTGARDMTLHDAMGYAARAKAYNLAVQYL